MARVNTKIGDVFSVNVSDFSKKYFQLVAFDLLQLNSDVIRVFKKQYSFDYTPNLAEIVNGEIEFYAHCITKIGVKMNIWEKAGNIGEVGNTSDVLFRDTNDYGTVIGVQPIKVSNNWYIWRINDESFSRVGKLTGANKEAEIGIVVNPHEILNRIKTGQYSFVYPDFE